MIPTSAAHAAGWSVPQAQDEEMLSPGELQLVSPPVSPRSVISDQAAMASLTGTPPSQVMSPRTAWSRETGPSRESPSSPCAAPGLAGSWQAEGVGGALQLRQATMVFDQDTLSKIAAYTNYMQQQPQIEELRGDMNTWALQMQEMHQVNMRALQQIHNAAQRNDEQLRQDIRQWSSMVESTLSKMAKLQSPQSSRLEELTRRIRDLEHKATSDLDRVDEVIARKPDAADLDKRFLFLENQQVAALNKIDSNMRELMSRLERVEQLYSQLEFQVNASESERQNALRQAQSSQESMTSAIEAERASSSDVNSRMMVMSSEVEALKLQNDQLWERINTKVEIARLQELERRMSEDIQEGLSQTQEQMAQVSEDMKELEQRACRTTASPAGDSENLSNLHGHGQQLQTSAGGGVEWGFLASPPANGTSLNIARDERGRQGAEAAHQPALQYSIGSREGSPLSTVGRPEVFPP